MKTQATDATLEEVRSHTVSLEHRRGDIDREECYPRLTVTWRREEVSVDASADRYRSSDGEWSNWRIIVRHCNPGMTDTARSAIRDAVAPLVEEWLDSDAYTESRRRAFRWMIRNELREERLSADYAAETRVPGGHRLRDRA